MTFISGLFLLLLGTLLVWTLRLAGPLRSVWKRHVLLEELRDCDFCLGFWVYLGLSLVSGETIVEWWPPANYTLTALVFAFLFFLNRTGWQTLFQELRVEVNNAFEELQRS